MWLKLICINDFIKLYGSSLFIFKVSEVSDISTKILLKQQKQTRLYVPRLNFILSRKKNNCDNSDFIQFIK